MDRRGERAGGVVPAPAGDEERPVCARQQDDGCWQARASRSLALGGPGKGRPAVEPGALQHVRASLVLRACARGVGR
eukprot:6060150-Alexandrium_andersonii.AAC.1